jgi:hypothetical protein
MASPWSIKLRKYGYMSQKLKIQVPDVLANELASEGLAEIQQTARSATWGLAWGAVSSASVVVSVMQTPETLKSFASDCVRLLRKYHGTQPGRLDAKGPGGQVSLTITADTDLDEVMRFLKKVLFVDVKTEDEA